MTAHLDQTAVFDFLVDPATHGLATPVHRIDTHGACVFLAGDDVYKIKRAVRFPYMDFSTIEKRKAACENEIAVNRGNAPGIYVGTVPITQDFAGLHIGGTGQIVEWAVRMHRFDEEATLDRLAGRDGLDANIVDRLAQAISSAHRRAPAATGTSAVAILRDVICETLEEFDGAQDELTARTVMIFRDSMLKAYAENETLLIQRTRNGKVRHCHGDLHLGNIVLHGGKLVLFDAIEFDDSLATIDILYDLAFPVMDLWERGFPNHACRLLNRYLWLSDDEGGEIVGLALLPLFLALRAAIRAKVLTVQANLGFASPREQIQRYIQVAEYFVKPPPARLVAIGGLSGTGKTVLADAMAFRIGAAPGALHLRSDIERKKVFGIGAQNPLPRAAYAPAVSEEIYRRLVALAEIALKAGHSVILDATFRSPNDRNLLLDTAKRAGVSFSGLWLEAPSIIRRSRVNARIGDASDATPQLVEAQDTEAIGLIDWPKIDAGRPIESVAASAVALLGLTSAS